MTYIKIIIITLVMCLIFLQLVASILFSKFILIVELLKQVNVYIRSYNRLLTMMISDSVYEMQFLQTIVMFSFLSCTLVDDLKFIFPVPREVLSIFILVCFFGLFRSNNDCEN